MRIGRTARRGWRPRLVALVLQVAVAALPHAASAISAQNESADGMTELRSDHGVLDVTLRAAEGKVHVGELELDGATYNGQYAGPVLRLRPGDLLRVRLVNALSQPTNLHFHGMRTSPLGNSDNVHLSVAPGETFTYEVRIPPTQPPGLYWYHSHLHGVSEHQVMAGLSGALIVEGLVPAGITERLLVLKDMVFDDDTGNATIDDELHGIVQSVNGRADSSFAIRPGETQFWRFSNQSANRIFHIAVPGHRFRVIAADGEAIVGERTEDVLDIMPAGRIEVLLEGGAPGSYALLSKGTMTGTGAARAPDRGLGHLVVAGEAAVPSDVAATAPPPALRGVAVAASRTFVFSQTTTLKANEQKFFIDGRLFDARRVDVRVPLGNVEEWTIRNDSDDLHVFHIHQLGFQVVEVNHVAVPFAGRIDTVRVPERGEVKLRLAFTDPLIVGRFMFHCHVLKHEDKGMMAQIEVYDPRAIGLRARLARLYLHLWWWLHGVPWSLCGLGYA
jgi:FtsP/CotA-like multicopper oxidase with cupredoxin domain